MALSRVIFLSKIKSLKKTKPIDFLAKYAINKPKAKGYQYATC